MLQQALALRSCERDVRKLAQCAGLPLGEVLAAPFALRAVAMGVEVGARTLLSEARAWVTPSLTSPSFAAVADPDHGCFHRGVRHAGKYQGFGSEEPFALYEPSYVSKWGPHELMHRAARFFYRPGLSRWELYIATRLNELVPVTLFYGPEQVMRLDDVGAFDRRRAAQRPDAKVGDALWWREDPGALRRRAEAAAPLMREGLVHFTRELAAIDLERKEGRRIPVEHPFLDSASDATAYVVGHHERLTSESVTQVLAHGLPAGSAVPRLGDYRDFVERLFDRLLFEPIQLDFGRIEAGQHGRRLWDLLLRAAHAAPAMAFGDLLPDARGAMEEANRGRPIDLAPFQKELSARLGRERSRTVMAQGFADCMDLCSLRMAIASVVPRSAQLLSDARLERFARSRWMLARRPIVERLLTCLEARPSSAVDDAADDPSEASVRALIELIRFEAALVSGERDDEVEHLVRPAEALPDSLDGGLVVRHRGFRALHFACDVVALQAGEADLEQVAFTPLDLLVGTHFESAVVIPAPEPVRALFERLGDEAQPAEAVREALEPIGEAAHPADDWPPDGEAWLRELLVAGALGWRPRAPT